MKKKTKEAAVPPPAGAPRDPLALVNALEDALFHLDAEARVVFVNRAGEELFGRSSREIVGKLLTDITADAYTVIRLARKATDESRSIAADDAAVKIGSLTRADLRVSPLFHEDRDDGVVVSVREHRSILGKEDAAFDSLVFLLGSIAHEIKNPLGGIKGAAQLLELRLREAAGAEGGTDVGEYVGLIIRETDRLNSVLQSYLTMSRKPALHPLNVHEVIEKAVSIMQLPLKNGKIRLQRRYDPSLPRVLGDEGKLLQVFVNIVKNAVEAMPRGGSLGIATKPSDEYVIHRGRTKRWAVVSFSDTGKGVPRDELQKIFLPFFTRKRQGTGLGLALSKKIVKDHDGFIKVESPDASGSGTAFHVYIPFS